MGHSFSRRPSVRLNDLAASNTPVMTKLAISKISEILVASPSEREAFVTDPSNFFEDRFGVRPGEKELEYLDNLKNVVADGWCCGGCACGVSDLGGVVTNPGLRPG